jgi:HrpA-like RNA helicase
VVRPAAVGVTERYLSYLPSTPSEATPRSALPGASPAGTQLPVSDYVEEAARTVLQLCHDKKLGNVLVFMPGTQEVEKTCLRIIKGLQFHNIQEVEVTPLYSP